MGTIRIVRGSASAPTAMASYDAALAEAGVENYNLVSVSSIIPAGADLEVVGTAPDLGSVGDRLTVVEARATAAGPGQVSAALAWSRSDEGPGLFYETAGETNRADVERRVRAGLRAGEELRDWTFADPEVVVESERADPGAHTTALVLAVYGDGEPIL